MRVPNLNLAIFVIRTWPLAIALKTIIERKLWSKVSYQQLSLAARLKGMSSKLCSQDSPIILLVHAHYPDFLHELKDTVISEIAFTKVLVSSSHPGVLREARRMGFESLEVPNLGRNLLPLKLMAESLTMHEAEVLHIHSKKSPQYHFRAGDTWRQKSIAALVNCLKSETNRPTLKAGRAIISPLDPREIRYSDFTWRNNRNQAIRFGIGGTLTFTTKVFFPVGGMFITNISSLRKIFETLDFSPSMFSEEPIPVDGDTVHFLERAIGLVLGEENTYFTCTETTGMFSAKQLRIGIEKGPYPHKRSPAQILRKAQGQMIALLYSDTAQRSGRIHRAARFVRTLSLRLRK